MKKLCKYNIDNLYIILICYIIFSNLLEFLLSDLSRSRARKPLHEFNSCMQSTIPRHVLLHQVGYVELRRLEFTWEIVM